MTIIGGKFAPHHDAPWTVGEEKASIYTVIFYLNDCNGGEVL